MQGLTSICVKKDLVAAEMTTGCSKHRNQAKFLKQKVNQKQKEFWPQAKPKIKAIIWLLRLTTADSITVYPHCKWLRIQRRHQEGCSWQTCYHSEKGSQALLHVPDRQFGCLPLITTGRWSWVTAMCLWEWLRPWFALKVAQSHPNVKWKKHFWLPFRELPRGGLLPSPLPGWPWRQRPVLLFG